jgi:hypothetical protein
MAEFHRLARQMAVAAVLLVACATSGPPTVPAYTYRTRVRELQIGQSIPDAHATLGSDRVRKPNHPQDPFDSPLQVLQLRDRSGRSIRIETYVIEAWRAQGCPDFHYRDVPVTYVDGTLSSIGWDELEWKWADWGGSLADLRAAQDRFACDTPAASDGLVGDGLDQQRESLQADDADR